ncbi:hypothetical protein BX661DRAFT_60849 [Kickxella alabastrina]|uniref:uncharacterized protein n=1 Tax=Kickxella alabastrina TaxID=61397 RepID=UPI0022202D3F|nr:uncharacterized protein BX661DRAFT_60849 [Kickxella alabastrina]KAI7822282.1 hypothetical protein BX661DRAFT_60849 [Kickxella alabastrina]
MEAVTAPSAVETSPNTHLSVAIGLTVALVSAIIIITYAMTRRRLGRMRSGSEQMELQMQAMRQRQQLLEIIERARSIERPHLNENQLRALIRRTITDDAAAAAAATAPEGVAETEHGEQYESARCCGICLMDYLPGDLIVDLPCSHAFHEACVLPWLKINDKCPFCSKSCCLK